MIKFGLSSSVFPEAHACHPLCGYSVVSFSTHIFLNLTITLTILMDYTTFVVAVVEGSRSSLTQQGQGCKELHAWAVEEEE